jgi:hypothetical protein
MAAIRKQRLKGGNTMTTLSIHPIEYLREHVDYAHVMKKLLRLVVVAGLTLFLVGGLYNTIDYTGATERDMVTQAYMNAFPSEMPNVVIDAFVCAPLA